jgi:outer membrane protein OmpA-like peptidoglycan-associated protein
VIVARRIYLWVAIAAVATATACGPKRVASPVPPDTDVIVLLPDADTARTGAATVTNPQGSVDLDAEREAAMVTKGRAPTLTTMSEADVQRIFGAALSALPPAPMSFTLYFRFESDEFTAESQALIPAVVAAVKKHAVQDVVVIGHTDTMGTQRANYALGLKRAMTVRNRLVAAGLDKSRIEVTSVGELEPFVKTPDETPEPRNRRVEVSVR